VNGPRKAGSDWQNWKIQQVLCWGQRGGLYRVAQGQQIRLLKELIVADAQIDQVLQAAAGWQKLGLAQAIELEEVSLVEGRICLRMPELAGQPLSLEVRGRATAPPEAVLLQWARQICDLVLALQQQQNPLALTLLEPEHMLVDPQGRLVVFNPGWGRLASGIEGLHKFARLMVFCATGAPSGSEKIPAGLPPALLWVVSRCLKDEYASFSELRQGLGTVVLEESRWPRSAQPSLEEFSLGEIPLPPPHRPLSRLFRLGLGLLGLLAVLGLGWALRASQSQDSRPAALALVRANRLLWLSLEGVPLGESDLPQAITCVLASLDGEQLLMGLEGQNGLTLMERDKREWVKVEGGSVPTQLLLSSDGHQVVALLKNGNLGHWKWAEGRLRWLGEVSWAEFVGEAQLTAVRDDGTALLIVPGEGMVLIDPQGKRERSYAGATSAILLNPLIVAANSSQSMLLALDSDLEIIGRQKIAGRTQLYPNSYQRGVWGVERGTVTLWSVPELASSGQIQLPGPALTVAPDPIGHLWTVTQSGQLCKLDSHPLSCQQLSQVGTCTALVYLAQPLTAKSSPGIFESR
jgi:hypothetical protein